MPRTIHSPRQRRLAELLTQARKDAGLTQVQVAKALGRNKPLIANIESGERRVDVIELLELAEIVGLDVDEVVLELKWIRKTNSLP